jgi:hypothetical protein
MERMQNVLIDTAMVSVKALACSSVNSGVFETSSRTSLLKTNQQTLVLLSGRTVDLR